MLTVKQISSLEKVLPERNCNFNELNEITVLKGERFSYQLAYSSFDIEYWKFSVESEIGEHIKIYRVRNVPVNFPLLPGGLEDSNYISHDGGLFPDRLEPFYDDIISSMTCYKALWITVDGDIAPGEYSIKFNFSKCFFDRREVDENAEKLSITIKVNVLPKALPPQDFIFTQWFHADCVKSFYGFETFSEEHWEMIEKFLSVSYQNGVNMVYVPVFTPPLDTHVGEERPTVQLIDVTLTENGYEFGFQKFDRWIDMCKKIGFQFFEISHLFTQWGAAFSPKVMATVNGEYQRIFGWDVSSADKKYADFLDELLPCIIKRAEDLGIAKNLFFHISDEPSDKDFENYSNASKILRRNIGNCKIMDAQSHAQFFLNGKCDIPVVNVSAIKNFFDMNIKDFWVYYCGEPKGVSNRMIAMPSCRNRFIAYQFYKYNIPGFLHWGLNFYYTRFSQEFINPFYDTDGDGTFAAGDAFSVYPAKDGPEISLRMAVFFEALQDLRAMKALEEYIGHEAVVSLVEGVYGKNITFSLCADSSKTVLDMRKAVNDKLKEYISGGLTDES